MIRPGWTWMALSGQIVEQTAKAEQTLLAGVVADRRTQFAKPAEPAQHMGIAAELGKSADLGKADAQISDEVAGHILILDHREGLQSQSEILDVRLENLFEGLSGLTHGIGGEGRLRAVGDGARIFAPDVLGSKLDIKQVV